MKKILLVFVMLLVLASCVGKEDGDKMKDLISSDVKKVEQVNSGEKAIEEKMKSDNLEVKQNENEVKQNETKVAETDLVNESQSGGLEQGNSPMVLENDNIAEEIAKDMQKVNEIRNSPDAYNFWFKDCKTLFKQDSGIRECQRLSLKEITVGCSDKTDVNGPGKVKINDLFNLNKFDLLNKEKVLESKKSCILDRKKQQAEEEQRTKQNESLNKVNKELENITNNFTLSDCSKYYTKGSIEKEIKKIQEDKQIPNNSKIDIIKNLEQNFVDPVEKCEISFAVSVKKDCSILAGDKRVKCEQAIEDIKVLKRMETNRANFGIFDTSIIRQELYKKNGIENILPDFNGPNFNLQNPEARFLPGGLR